MHKNIAVAFSTDKAVALGSIEEFDYSGGTFRHDIGTPNTQTPEAIFMAPGAQNQFQFPNRQYSLDLSMPYAEMRGQDRKTMAQQWNHDREAIFIANRNPGHDNCGGLAFPEQAFDGIIVGFRPL